MKNVILDTNILMNNIDLTQYNKIYVALTVLEELDKHKHSDNNEKAYKARKAIHIIKNAKNIEYRLEFSATLPQWLDLKSPDNRILGFAKDITEFDKESVLLTMDLNMIEKAKALEIPVEEWIGNNDFDDSYKGFKEVILDEYEMATFYECMINKWDLFENEYLVIKDGNGDVCDKLKWTNKGFKQISYKTVDSRYVGKVKPRNLQQELYMDILQDKDTKVKVVQGGYGTGKDYLALANFIQMVEKGNYQKIVWIRNNIEADGTKPIGYLPGSLTEKLSVFADIVGDFVGDKVGFEMLLNSGKLELVHTGFLRGRDLRNSIIYCTEAQNMSDALVKLILSRISEGSIAFFNGDVKQIDDKNFKKNNGLDLMINKLKGKSLFGYVYLDKCERSEVAQLAALLD